MSSTGRTAAVLLAVVVLTVGCGQPDADQTPAPMQTPTVISTSDGTELSSPSEPPTTSASASGSVEPAPPADPLGVAGVVPWSFVTQDDIDKATAMVASLTIAQRAGSVVVASSADTVGTSEIADLGLAGLNLLGTRGVVAGTKAGTPAQVAGVITTLNAQRPAAQAGFPLLIGVDQEYGDVTRLVNGFTDLPGASELGSIKDLPTAVAMTTAAAEVSAAEMAAVGFNLDFAPVSDVLPTKGSSAIGNRSYGSDPQRVSALVAAAVQGYQSGGIAATLKHFPGIGGIAADSHVTLGTVTANCDQWNASGSAPVRAGVNAGVSLVMTGHTLFPAVDSGKEPTSLSQIVITDLLRGDPAKPLASGCLPVGFRGLTVSDSEVMAPIVNAYSTGEAAWRSLAAGEDIVLMPGSPAQAVAGIVGAVESKDLAEARLNEASVRAFALRSALSRTPRPALTTVNSAVHRAVAAQVRNAIG